MGMWDYINSATDKVRRNAPDLTPVRNACWSSYDFSRASVAEIDHAVRENVVPTLKHHLSDDEGRAKLGRFAASIAKTAADYCLQEGLKWVPGGIQLYNFVKDSNKNKNPDLTVPMEEMQARMEKMEEEMNNIKQKSKISNQSAKASEPLKEFPDEPVKGSVPLRTDPKRVFIRSRL